MVQGTLLDEEDELVEDSFDFVNARYSRLIEEHKA